MIRRWIGAQAAQGRHEEAIVGPGPTSLFKLALSRPKSGVVLTWAFAVLGLLGCGSASDWMPLRQGKSWQYYLKGPRGSKVVQVTVSERCRVGVDDGWLLDGVAGQSRLVWKGSSLFASELTAVRFDPPIELLKPSTETASWNYTGECDGRIARVPVSGKLKQKPEKLTVGGVARDCIRVTLEIKIGTANTVLDSWFSKGIGIIRQEQRINESQVALLELVSS